MGAPMEPRVSNLDAPARTIPSPSIPAPRAPAKENAPGGDVDLRDRINRNRKKNRNTSGGGPPSQDEKPQAQRRPPGEAPNHAQAKGRKKKGGRNTQSFTPSAAPPDLKVVFGDARKPVLARPMHGRHVTVVPSFFCDEDDERTYDALLREIRAAGSPDMWIPWHEASHYIANDRERHGAWKKDSPTFEKVVAKIAEYFRMDVKATRFNWYRDQEEWKPYHHDAAAVKPDKAKTQNCTVAVSFGATRDVAFEHAKTGTTVFVPQPNGAAYAFGHDVNVEWRHGVPQVPAEIRSGTGGDAPRVSIIAWGWVDQDRDDISSFA